MLGSFISCDDYGGDNDNHNYNYYGNGDGAGCVRYVMWAAYVNPNYQGGGRAEYFGYNSQNNNGDDYYTYTSCSYNDDGVYTCYSDKKNDDDDNNSKVRDSKGIDCHLTETEWELLGVYRQDFYEFFEQVTKHLWYYNDYEYKVASAALDYMGDGSCNYKGYDNRGNTIYYAPRPTSGGRLEMGLYRDSQCLDYIDEDEDEIDYETFFGTSQSYGDDYYYRFQNSYSATQEYTLTIFNEVFDDFRYCTLCMDYPSYQDGYFNGDSGTDEDDLINQCWKFYSHDTYVCGEDCVALGDAQGTITTIKYGDKYYGVWWDGTTEKRSRLFFGFKSNKDRSDRSEHSRANAYLLANLCLFCLAFYVTQNSSSRSYFKKTAKKMSRIKFPKIGISYPGKHRKGPSDWSFASDNPQENTKKKKLKKIGKKSVLMKGPRPATGKKKDTVVVSVENNKGHTSKKPIVVSSKSKKISHDDLTKKKAETDKGSKVAVVKKEKGKNSSNSSQDGQSQNSNKSFRVFIGSNNNDDKKNESSGEKKGDSDQKGKEAKKPEAKEISPKAQGAGNNVNKFAGLQKQKGGLRRKTDSKKKETAAKGQKGLLQKKKDSTASKSQSVKNGGGPGVTKKIQADNDTKETMKAPIHTSERNNIEATGSNDTEYTNYDHLYEKNEIADIEATGSNDTEYTNYDHLYEKKVVPETYGSEEAYYYAMEDLNPSTEDEDDDYGDSATEGSEEFSDYETDEEQEDVAEIDKESNVEFIRSRLVTKRNIACDGVEDNLLCANELGVIWEGSGSEDD